MYPLGKWEGYFPIPNNRNKERLRDIYVSQFNFQVFPVKDLFDKLLSFLDEDLLTHTKIISRGVPLDGANGFIDWLSKENLSIFFRLTYESFRDTKEIIFLKRHEVMGSSTSYLVLCSINVLTSTESDITNFLTVIKNSLIDEYRN